MGKILALINSLGTPSEAAHEALCRYRARALPELRRQLRSNPSELVREQCAEILGAIGDTGAVPDLIDALNDESSHVRWDALRALEKILFIDIGTWLQVDAYNDDPKKLHRTVASWWRAERRRVWW